MTKADAARMIGLIVTAYPNSDKFRDDEAVGNAVTLWADLFADDNEAIVETALKKHISISRWPPSIAEIREIMTEIQNPDLIPPDEAWGLVARYIDASGEHDDRIYTHPDEIFPQAVMAAINAVGYGNLRDLRVRRYDQGGKKAGLDRLAFMQAYEPEYQRQRVNATLPSCLREKIDETQKRLAGESRRLVDKTEDYITRKEADSQKYYQMIERLQYQNLMLTKED